MPSLFIYNHPAVKAIANKNIERLKHTLPAKYIFLFTKKVATDINTNKHSNKG